MSKTNPEKPLFVDDESPKNEKHKAGKGTKEKSPVLTSTVKLSRIAPWSCALNALFLGVVGAVSMVGAVAIVWFGFDYLGVFDKIVETAVPDGKGAEKLEAWLSLSKFLQIGFMLSIVLVVALPVFAFFTSGVFNLIARITGGVRVELSDKQFDL